MFKMFSFNIGYIPKNIVNIIKITSTSLFKGKPKLTIIIAKNSILYIINRI